MNEEEWLNCTDLTPMLEFLQGKVSDRKLRLFCCGCCRTVWDEFDSQFEQRAIDAVERFVDGNATSNELDTFHQHSKDCLTEATARNEQSEDDGSPESLEIALFHCRAALIERTIDPFGWATNYLTGTRRAKAASISQWIVDCRYFRNWLAKKRNLTKPARDAMRSLHCRLLRDIVGNPSHHVTFAPAWLTSTVLELTRLMYESRDFSAMPILADALQDAGCENDDILSHCRDEKQVHVRGCWVVDLVLGKS